MEIYKCGKIKMISYKYKRLIHVQVNGMYQIAMISLVFFFGINFYLGELCQTSIFPDF